LSPVRPIIMLTDRRKGQEVLLTELTRTDRIQAMTTKTMKFAKAGQNYIFRYRNDMQDEMIDHIMGLAESSEYNVDWLDAATLSFQIAQHAAIGDSGQIVPSIEQK
jgi:hypothetical protein